MISEMVARPPFVTFENMEIEDRDASIAVGYYQSKLVPFASITPVGGRDNLKKIATEWLTELRQQGRSGIVPMTWYDHFNAAFLSWQEGNEIPEFGTPIITFLPFTPNQRQALIKCNIRTLEDCAEMNEDTMSRIGMGAHDLKRIAKNALKSSNVLLAENEALKVKLENMQIEIDALKQRGFSISTEVAKKRGRPSLVMKAG